MDQKQSDVLTLIHLIKTESARTREELTKHFDEKITSELKKTEKRFNEKMKVGFENQKKELTTYLDDKFEDHRRKIVDEIQTFEDHILKDNLRLDQELNVNSARIEKIEHHPIFQSV